jgi:acyl-CoA synthetase (AMP-forming)/AMP-acid ligase II
MVRQNSRQLENDLFSKAGFPTKRAKVDTEWQPASIDPLVELSPNAPQATKEFWFQNGHPHSKRYSNPELVSIGAIIRYNATVYQDMTGFLYPSAADNGATYMPITWGEFDDITETVAAMYAHLLTQELAGSKTTAEQPTVAMLGTGNTVEYFITQMSLQKLNMRVLLLASGNSAEAIRHLLSKCNALAVIVDSRLASVDTNGVRKIPMVETIPSPNSTARRSVDAMRYKNNGDPWERQTFIIHSSGSTGPPKPLSHTNRSLMLINRMYRLFPDFHITNWILCAPL